DQSPAGEAGEPEDWGRSEAADELVEARLEEARAAGAGEPRDGLDEQEPLGAGISVGVKKAQEKRQESVDCAVGSDGQQQQITFDSKTGAGTIRFGAGKFPGAP